MTRLDRYLASNVLLAFSIALGGLLAVFSVVNLTEELRDIGTGQYNLPLALWFVAMTLPSEAYELFAAACLVGATGGLAWMASYNELVAVESAGVSPMHTLGGVLKTAGALALSAALLGEFVAAPLAESALQARSIALSGGQSLGTAHGIWMREGRRFINIRRPSDGEVSDIYMFDFDEAQELRKVTRAAGASHDDGGWQLSEVSEDLFEESGVIRKTLPAEEWQTVLTPQQLHLLMLPPEQLSLADLSASVAAIEKRGESAQQHLLAYWRRLTMPLVAAIMVFLGLPMVLSLPPRIPFGFRIAAAALAGIGFQMASQTFSSFGLVYGLNAFLCATLPAALALAVGLWQLRRSPAWG